MIELRPYQEQIVADTRQGFRERVRTILIQLATGGGKTALGSVMVHGAAAKGNVCWWLVHRRELLTQASITFSALGIPHGIVRAGHMTDPTALVQIASIQTIARKLDKLPAPDMIVFDEAHHLGAAQWQSIFDAFPNAAKVGLTATPWRLDGRGLGQWFGRMIQGPAVSDLIEDGHLSAYRLFAPSSADVSAVEKTGGDYKRDQLSKIMDKPSITGDAVQHYLRLANGKRAVAFAVSIEHSQHIAADFRSQGVAAEHVDGQMDHSERDAVIARFVAGQTLVLSNADLLGEGFDVPAIEAAILLRPTASLSLYLQQIGRALRPAPGKAEAIILDHAGNSERHGLPDDDREWSLDDRPKRERSGETAAPIKKCAKCYRIYRPAPKCPGCGHQPPIVSREIEQVDGVLAEIDVSAKKRLVKMEEARCETLADWIDLGVRRGYKSPAGWAHHRHQARQRRAA